MLRMGLPLALLAIGAVFAGGFFAGSFVGDGKVAFWNGALITGANDVMDQALLVPTAVVKAPFVVMLVGFFTAMMFYAPKVSLGKMPALAVTLVLLAVAIVSPALSKYVAYYAWFFFTWALYATFYAFGKVSTDLPQRTAETFSKLYQFLLNKWYWDELFDLIFVRPSFALGRIFWKRGDEKTIDGFGPDGVSSAVASIAAQVRKLQTGYVYHYAFVMIIGLAAIVTWFMTQAGGAGH